MRKTEDYNVTFTDNSAAPKVKVSKEKSKFGIFDFTAAIVAAIIVIAILFTFLFRVITVKGTSMRPTLSEGNRVVTSAFGYSPVVGDIVVLSGAPGVSEPIVKRIIAVGGDVVDINFATGVVTVNGNEEDYSDELTNQQYDIAFPITVPEGSVFVLGDNRKMSLDSRSSAIGCIDERNIVGKVLFRIYPLFKWTVE